MGNPPGGATEEKGCRDTEAEKIKIRAKRKHCIDEADNFFYDMSEKEQGQKGKTRKGGQACHSK